jgi:predicted transcriptional regulator of viral defense system
MNEIPRRLPQGRAQLVRVLAAAGDVIRVDDVAGALDLDRIAAAQRLSRWMQQGWINRVGRGAYVPAAIDTLGAERTLDDPWVLVPALFAPGYIGGRTAAEHWDLTEQIFKDVVVMTTLAVRERQQSRQGVQFTLKHIDPRKLFGTKSVWRHQSRVPVSDVHRTIVDILDDPAVGGGIQHVAECLNAYLRRDDRNDANLVDYALQLGNGAVFKRLGFLAECQPGTDRLVNLCLKNISGGHASLDPALPGARIVSKWRLRVPDRWVHQVRA